MPLNVRAAVVHGPNQPFVIENVQLVKSTMILVDGKEVTEFQLDARYQYPDSSAIRTQPVALSVR